MLDADDEYFGRDKDPADGASGHVVLPPDELLMRSEEGEFDDVEWSVSEVFRRILCFVFHDPRSSQALGWDYAAAAIEVLYREYAPSVWLHCGPDASSRRRGVGLVSGAGHGVHQMVRDVPERIVSAVLVKMAAHLDGALWILELTRRYYALAKVFDEDLIGSASLEMLGDIFGESNRKSSRARWSARIPQVLRHIGGAHAAHVHGRYMKSDVARAKMAESAKGNQNRKKS